ncbi:MAG: aminotransferase class V-fold PLP-dependent enzyme [Candidatus Limnocylindrus sp.]
MPSTEAGIYLNAGSNGPLPAEVDAAMRAVHDQELQTGRATEHAMDDVEERANELRGVFAGVLATDLDLVAIGHSTTESVLRPALGLEWRAGDRIITFDEEYPAIRGSLAALAARTGVVIQTLSLCNAASQPLSDDEIVASVLPLLDAPTRLLLLSRVSWISGRTIPVAPLLAAARAAGVTTVLDGAQGVGAVRDDIDALNPDLLAFPSQKWLLGVEGLAGIRVSREALAAETFRPIIGGYMAFDGQPLNGLGTFRPDARRYQVSGFSRPALAGAARAAGWLSMQVGLPWAIERAQRLAAQFHAAVRAVPGVEMLAPAGGHATIVSLRVAGWKPEQLVEELSRRAFAITRRVPSLPPIDGRPGSAAALRTSWGFWNTEAEVARIAELITLIASHTPETLPKRPTIEILHG